MNLITRRFLLTTSTAALVAPLAAAAQPVGKVYKVGVLLSTSRFFESTRVEAFRQGLRERGYIEDQNIVIESRYGERRSRRASPR
jgi:putative ABC transport system substrate-binding protein